jgi:hypothetical protein
MGVYKMLGKAKYKGEHGGEQVESASREGERLLLGTFKTLRYSVGREEPGIFHPITNEWGECGQFLAR